MEQEIQQIQNEQAYDQEYQDQTAPTEMEQSQEVNLNQEESKTYPLKPEDCSPAHEVIIESPNGNETVRGTCKRCGIEKEYPVYPYDRYYAERRSGRGPALNL